MLNKTSLSYLLSLGLITSFNIVNTLAQGHNPYKGRDFAATAFFKCSINNAHHDQQCPGGIIRKNNSNASVTILFTNRQEVTYNFRNVPMIISKTVKSPVMLRVN
jgi:hypothetical protein